MHVRQLLAILAVALLASPVFSQGLEDCGNFFSKQELLEWKKEMKFKSKYFNNKAFENFLLDIGIFEYAGLVGEVRDLGQQYADEEQRLLTEFQEVLHPYYGKISTERLKKWFIPYYVFFQIDRAGEAYKLLEQNKGQR